MATDLDPRLASDRKAAAAGAARMRWPRFAVANALGAFAWAASISAAADPTGSLALAASGLSLGADSTDRRPGYASAAAPAASGSADRSTAMCLPRAVRRRAPIRASPSVHRRHDRV